MRFSVLLILFLLLIACKKGNDISGFSEERILITDFSYVNPKGKILSDSIIYLPISGTIAPVYSALQLYNGAEFVSNTRRESNDNKGYPAYEGVYINWKVRDLASNLIIQDVNNTSSFLLNLYRVGKYKLTQYVYTSSDNRDKSINPVDSVSKMIIVNDLLNIDSISVESFSFSSPYLNLDLDRSSPVDALVAMYKDKSSLEKGDEPFFKTELMKGLKENTVSLKFGVPQNNTIPSIYSTNDENGDCLIQLNVVQDGNSYTIIDNVWGLIFKYLTKGYYSGDKSKLLNEQVLRFGNMKLKIWTSYKFME